MLDVKTRRRTLVSQPYSVCSWELDETDLLWPWIHCWMFEAACHSSQCCIQWSLSQTAKLARSRQKGQVGSQEQHQQIWDTRLAADAMEELCACSTIFSEQAILSFSSSASGTLAKWRKIQSMNGDGHQFNRNPAYTVTRSWSCAYADCRRAHRSAHQYF